MALINCAECQKEISDKALTCPNCGLPLASASLTEVMIFPNLPNDLGIGKPIVNWGGDSSFAGHYSLEENTNTKIPEGKVTAMLHTHGINILSSYRPMLQIHNAQIISIKKTSRVDLIQMDKSVIGRAVVGGLILGPLGAIIGGMSGVGNKEKVANKSYMVINFWDTDTKTAQTLLISGEALQIQNFINRNQKEEKTNQTENRQAEKPKGCLGVLLILFTSLLWYLI